MEKSINIQEQKRKVKRRIKIDGVIWALICIAIGVVFLGRNTGFISEYLFSILISWQMLLIVIGLYSITHRVYLWGALVAGIGLFFLTPLIMETGKEWIAIYWPLIFVFIGLLWLMKLILPKKKKNHFDMDTDFNTEDGFVNSINSFSGTRHVVMDEVFKGARIKNSFGATELDLRRTTLLPGNTYIDIESRFGGIEIYVPDNWLVFTELDTVMAGVSDERKSLGAMDEKSKLILRGKLKTSGIVLKN